MNLNEKNIINVHINNLLIVCRLCGTYAEDVNYHSINQEALLINLKEVLNFEVRFFKFFLYEKKNLIYFLTDSL